MAQTTGKRTATIDLSVLQNYPTQTQAGELVEQKTQEIRSLLGPVDPLTLTYTGSQTFPIPADFPEIAGGELLNSYPGNQRSGIVYTSDFNRSGGNLTFNFPLKAGDVITLLPRRAGPIAEPEQFTVTVAPWQSGATYPAGTWVQSLNDTGIWEAIVTIEQSGSHPAEGDGLWRNPAGLGRVKYRGKFIVGNYYNLLPGDIVYVVGQGHYETQVALTGYNGIPAIDTGFFKKIDPDTVEAVFNPEYDALPTLGSTKHVRSNGIAVGTNNAITTLKQSLVDGAPSDADTFQKLRNLIASNAQTELTVANQAAMYAVNATNGQRFFVQDDGDGKWATYRANSTGTQASGNTYTKTNDQDLLTSSLSNAQIKTAYESNPDTNAFTNLLLSKLTNLTQYTSNDVRGVLLPGLDTSVFTNIATTDTILAAFGKVAYYLNFFDKRSREAVLSGYTDAAVNSFLANGDQFQVAFGKLQKQLKDHDSRLAALENVEPEPTVLHYAQGDGVDASIVSPNFPFDLSLTDWAYEIYLSTPLNTSGNTQYIMEKGAGGILVALGTNNKLRIGISNTLAYYLETPVITANTRYHLVLNYTKATNTMTGYMQGAQFGTKSAVMPAAAINTSGVHYLSRNGNAITAALAKVYRSRWYNGPILATPAQQLYEGERITQNLQLEYLMQGNANDTSGFNRHASLFGNPVFASEPI